MIFIAYIVFTVLACYVTHRVTLSRAILLAEKAARSLLRRAEEHDAEAKRQQTAAFCNWASQDTMATGQVAQELPFPATREAHALVQGLLGDPELTPEAKAVVNQAADQLGEDAVAKIAKQKGLL